MSTPWHSNAALVLLTLVLSLVFTLSPGASQMGSAGAAAVAVVSAVAVGLSLLRPGAALVAVAGLVLAQPALDVRFVAADLVAVLVAYRAAAHTGLHAWLLAGATFTLLTVHDWWLHPWAGRTMDPSLLYPAMVTALCVGLGLRSRRVQEQGLELARLRSVDRDRAVSEERRRIARDLHDVAAHHLSALVVHNRLAQRLATDEAFARAVEFSAVTASETLDSLRHVVGTLSTEGDAPRAPTPLLRDLPSIVARVGAAGLRVHLGQDAPEELGVLDDELQVALVRVAQEALSNVLRHRGPGQCWVELRRDGSTVTLTIDDDGPTAPAVPPTETETETGGYGLLGMRERVHSRGGRLVLEPSPWGGRRVQAVFDLRTAAT